MHEAMGVMRHIRARLSVLLGSERGMAVPLVLTVMTVAIGFSAVAIAASVSAQHATTRDEDSKDALAIADAGMQRALLNLNSIETTASEPCVVKTGTGPSASLDNGPIITAYRPWCRPVGGVGNADAKVGNGYFTYWVKPCLAIGQLCDPRSVEIVSEGYQDGIARRVSTTAVGEAGSLTTPGVAKVIALDGITMNSNSKIWVPTATNGSIDMDSNSEICSDVQVGPPPNDVTFSSNAELCPGSEISHGTTSLAPIDISALNFTGNTRLTNVNQAGGDSKAGIPDNSSGFSWNPSTKRLVVGGNVTLTLSGQDYLLCEFEMNANSSLIMAAGAQVRLFFDSPENCGLPSGSTQIALNSNAEIDSTSWNPSGGNLDLPGFYMVGSTTLTTIANFSANSNLSEFQLYAPRTDVIMHGNTDYIGTVAVKSLDLNANAEINTDSHLQGPGGATTNYTLYKAQHYVECGPSGGVVGANC